MVWRPLSPAAAKSDTTAPAASNGSAPAPAPGKKLKLAFVTNNAATFWTIARAGCEEAAKELGNVDVDFRIPSTGSAAEQQQILDDLSPRAWTASPSARLIPATRPIS